MNSLSLKKVVRSNRNIIFNEEGSCLLYKWLGLVSLLFLFLPAWTLQGNPSYGKIFLEEVSNRDTILSSPYHTIESIHDYSQKPGWKANPEVVRSREQSSPEFLWKESDVADYELPDPLEKSDGSSITSVEHWPQQRTVLLNTFRENMYGRHPGLPEELSFEIIEEDESAMEGAATLRRVEIQSAHKGRTHRFELILFLPNRVSNPVPVFLLMNNRPPGNTDPTRQEKSGFWPAEQVIGRGYGIAAIQNSEMAPDDTEKFHEGVIKLFEGETAAGESPSGAWAAISAWGWGASRVMDYFETDDRVDCSKVAVLGHSRGGKASLWAGAEDQRFALVISNNSGSGGAALSKRRFGETVEAVNRFTHWFIPEFMHFNGQEDKLHFDQHMLVSLIAPRAVYIASADEDLWADPRGEFLSLVHASPVYGLWGYAPIDEDNMPSLDARIFSGPRGYHIRSGGHNLTPLDWQNFMDFADRLWR